MLPNKGKIFLDVLKMHNYTNCVEAVLGKNFILSSYNANIAKPGVLQWTSIQINGGILTQ